VPDKPRSDLVKEYLRPDPRGYYIIPATRQDLEKLPESLRKQVEVEEVSGIEIVMKTRSRAIAKKILMRLGIAKSQTIERSTD